MTRMTLPTSPTTTPKGTLPTTVAQYVMRSPSWAARSIGADSARADMSGVAMPTVSARNQYALEMSRQLSTRPAVWMTDSMPEYARTQLATPTVTAATACGSPDPVSDRMTLC